MATRSDAGRIQVQELSQTRGKDEIEKGKVGEALQKFQVHEDTALAYKMQSTEYKNHVSRNKDQRKSVRDNIKTAKQTYLEEVKNAGILPEDSVTEIEQKQWLAEELQKRIEEQEDLARKQLEIQRQKDERIALQVQRDEEKRLRFLEHKRQQRIAKDEEEHRRLRNIMKELEEADLSDPGDDVLGDDVIRLPENHDIIVLADGIAIDARHNQIQTEEQKRQNMERRDEELAKILQQQEDHQIEKRRSMHEDYRKAIELQDREIAKHIQRQEKAKAERRREKQMRRAQSMPAEREELTSSQKRNLPTYHEAVDDFAREDVPPVDNGSHRVDTRREGEPDRGERHHPRTNSREDGYEEIWHVNTGAKSQALTSRMLESDASQEPGGHYNNIAEALDPTFQRKSRRAADEYVGEENDKASGSKGAPIVPALKRKILKDKGKKIKGKK